MKASYYTKVILVYLKNSRVSFTYNTNGGTSPDTLVALKVSKPKTIQSGSDCCP
jgi:hypothetical protein